MAARPTLRTVPADRRSQMDAIRRREDDALITASKAEADLKAAETRLAQLVESQQGRITKAQSQLGAAYREVVEAFGSQSRAAEYLDITPSQLRSVLAAAPDLPDRDESQTSTAEESGEAS